jgi:hypothetical protein
MYLPEGGKALHLSSLSPPSSLSCDAAATNKGGSGSAGGEVAADGGRGWWGWGSGRLEVRVRGCQVGAGGRVVEGAAGGEVAAGRGGGGGGGP